MREFQRYFNSLEKNSKKFRYYQYPTEQKGSFEMRMEKNKSKGHSYLPENAGYYFVIEKNKDELPQLLAIFDVIYDGYKELVEPLSYREQYDEYFVVVSQDEMKKIVRTYRRRKELLNLIKDDRLSLEDKVSFLSRLISGNPESIRILLETYKQDPFLIHAFVNLNDEELIIKYRELLRNPNRYLHTGNWVRFIRSSSKAIKKAIAQKWRFYFNKRK
jgi:hypothetical protein